VRLLVTLGVLFISSSAPLQQVPKITAGDRLKFGDQRVRLFGIDAPELTQTCDHGVWAAGRIAKEALRKLIADRPVRCEQVEWDGRNKGPISRCFVDDTDLSAAMVERGLAWASVRDSAVYVDVERRAATNGVGLHAHKCVPAWEWRELSRRRMDRLGSGDGPS
jgi:endonuclease YncB( thermonuclease family)